MSEYFGKEVQKLGFGLMRLPKKGEEIDIEQVKQMVDMFLEAGFTYFDTAFVYQGSELTDCLKRQLAEFDNFRKRTEREKAQMFEVGAKSVIEKMLPVVDNFERGLSAVPKDAKEDPFVQGMDKIYKQFMTELENLEVKPIEAVGTEFNPDYHNAVMQVESEEYESGVVAQELQKGYMYRDSVVRHSMVAVVQ